MSPYNDLSRETLFNGSFPLFMFQFPTSQDKSLRFNSLKLISIFNYHKLHMQEMVMRNATLISNIMT